MAKIFVFGRWQERSLRMFEMFDRECVVPMHCIISSQ